MDEEHFENYSLNDALSRQFFNIYKYVLINLVYNFFVDFTSIKSGLEASPLSIFPVDALSWTAKTDRLQSSVCQIQRRWIGGLMPLFDFPGYWLKKSWKDIKEKVRN